MTPIKPIFIVIICIISYIILQSIYANIKPIYKLNKYKVITNSNSFLELKNIIYITFFKKTYSNFLLPLMGCKTDFWNISKDLLETNIKNKTALNITDILLKIFISIFLSINNKFIIPFAIINKDNIINNFIYRMLIKPFNNLYKKLYKNTDRTEFSIHEICYHFSIFINTKDDIYNHIYNMLYYIISFGNGFKILPKYNFNQLCIISCNGICNVIYNIYKYINNTKQYYHINNISNINLSYVILSITMENSNNQPVNKLDINNFNKILNNAYGITNNILNYEFINNKTNNKINILNYLYKELKIGEDNTINLINGNIYEYKDLYFIEHLIPKILEIINNKYNFELENNIITINYKDNNLLSEIASKAIFSMSALMGILQNNNETINGFIKYINFKNDLQKLDSINTITKNNPIEENISLLSKLSVLINIYYIRLSVYEL